MLELVRGRETLAQHARGRETLAQHVFGTGCVRRGSLTPPPREASIAR